MKIEDGKKKFSFSEIMKRFGFRNDDKGTDVKSSQRMNANAEDLAKMGAEVMRLEDKVESIERKVNKETAHRYNKTIYNEDNILYPNGKLKRKSKMGLAPGFKRPESWAKTGPKPKKGKK
jgi:hypothetical protein